MIPSVPVHDLLVVEVLEPLQHLLRVVCDGPLVALQGSPLGLQQLLQGTSRDLKRPRKLRIKTS